MITKILFIGLVSVVLINANPAGRSFPTPATIEHYDQLDFADLKNNGRRVMGYDETTEFNSHEDDFVEQNTEDLGSTLVDSQLSINEAPKAKINTTEEFPIYYKIEDDESENASDCTATDDEIGNEKLPSGKEPDKINDHLNVNRPNFVEGINSFETVRYHIRGMLENYVNNLNDYNVQTRSVIQDYSNQRLCTNINVDVSKLNPQEAANIVKEINDGLKKARDELNRTLQNGLKYLKDYKVSIHFETPKVNSQKVSDSVIGEKRSVEQAQADSKHTLQNDLTDSNVDCATQINIKIWKGDWQEGESISKEMNDRFRQAQDNLKRWLQNGFNDLVGNIADIYGEISKFIPDGITKPLDGIPNHGDKSQTPSKRPLAPYDRSNDQSSMDSDSHNPNGNVPRDFQYHNPGNDPQYGHANNNLNSYNKNFDSRIPNFYHSREANFVQAPFHNEMSYHPKNDQFPGYNRNDNNLGSDPQYGNDYWDAIKARIGSIQNYLNNKMPHHRDNGQFSGYYQNNNNLGSDPRDGTNDSNGIQTGVDKVKDFLNNKVPLEGFDYWTDKFRKGLREVGQHVGNTLHKLKEVGKSIVKTGFDTAVDTIHLPPRLLSAIMD